VSSVLDGPSSTYPAAVHDEHAFGKRLAEVDVVGDEDQARARLRGERNQQLHDLDRQGRVQRTGRLVCDEEARVSCEGERHHDALSHTARQFVWPALHHSFGIGHADLAEPLRRLGLGILREISWVARKMSMSWLPTVHTGSRDVLASWKTIASPGMRCGRRVRLRCAIEVPWNVMASASMTAFGWVRTQRSIAGVLTHPNAVIEADAITFQGTSTCAAQAHAPAAPHSRTRDGLPGCEYVPRPGVDCGQPAHRHFARHPGDLAQECQGQGGGVAPQGRHGRSRTSDEEPAIRTVGRYATSASWWRSPSQETRASSSQTSRPVRWTRPLSVEIMQLLVALTTETGTGLILVTHDIHLGQAFTERMLVMYGGRIVEEGPSSTLDTTAVHPYTQALMRSVPTLESAGPGRPAHHSDLSDGPARPGRRMQFPSTVRPGTRRLRSPAAAHRTWVAGTALPAGSWPPRASLL